MKEVKQMNEFCCVVACLEAILSEIGIEKSQGEIIKDNPDVFDQHGTATHASDWIKVFKKYGITSTYDYIHTCDLDKLKRISSKPNVKTLLLWKKEALHAVGLNCIKENGDIEVMDPKLGALDIYDTEKQKKLDLAAISFQIEIKK